MDEKAVAAQAKAEAGIKRWEAALRAASSAAGSTKSAAAAVIPYHGVRAEYLVRGPHEKLRARDAPPEGAEVHDEVQVLHFVYDKECWQEAQVLAQVKRNKQAAASTTTAAEKELQAMQGAASTANPVPMEV
jgi:hypothetical protein